MYASIHRTRWPPKSLDVPSQCIDATFDGNKWLNDESLTRVNYDPKEPAIAIFSRWKGTVLPLIVNSQMFHLLLLIHFFFLFINFFVRKLEPMDSEVIVGLPASMLIFLEVFYNGNCYTRYGSFRNEGSCPA